MIFRILTIFSLLFLLSCNSEKKEEAKSSGAGGKTPAGLPILPNTWQMSLSTHAEGSIYPSTTIYYGPVKGFASAASGVSGLIFVKYQTFVNNQLVYEGSGGWLNSEKYNGSFQGQFLLNSIKLQDNTRNKVRVIVKDQINNMTFKEFFVDTDASAPEVTIDTPASVGQTFWTNDPDIVLSGSAYDFISVKEIRWKNNTTSATGIMTGTDLWAGTIALSFGMNNIVLTSEDNAGNTKNFNIYIGRDVTAPTITIQGPTTASRYIDSNNVTSINISGQSTEPDSGLDSVTWTNALTSQTGYVTGLYNWSHLNLPVAQGENLITVTATNKVGLTDSATLEYVVDLTSPTITDSTLVLAGGAPTTGNNLISVEFSATDIESKITHYCLKFNDTQEPAFDDTCFQAVPTPAKSVAINTNFTIGVGANEYHVYAWVKDEANRISTLSNSGSGTLGKDKGSIFYVPGNVPEVQGLLLTNTNIPSNPQLPSELTIGAGGTVYIKWKIYDVEGLHANPVSLSYSTDEITWIPIAQDLLNTNYGTCTADHAGTTADNGFTGCYTWVGGASANYFRIKLVVKDDSLQTTTQVSAPMNAGKINILAGNTDTGLGGSAASAAFLVTSPNYLFQAEQSFAVASDGIMYVLDPIQGILVITPNNGKVTKLVTIDGAAAAGTGDGGPASIAKVKVARAISLDHEDNLLIFDYDRIRRVTKGGNPVINTIIGGGTNTADTVAVATDVKITPFTLYKEYQRMPFTVFPNGDILFLSENSLDSKKPSTGHRIRHFHYGTGEVTAFTPSGTGLNTNGAYDITNTCVAVLFATHFNPVDSSILENYWSCGSNTYFRADGTTNVSTAPHPPAVSGNYAAYGRLFTGRNGKVYLMSRVQGDLYRYNDDVNTWTKIAGWGGGVNGNCADGTPATSCKMQLLDAWVSSNDEVYLFDGGAIRKIDGSGNITTLYGQSWYYGDGQNALSARFKYLRSLDKWNDGGVVKVATYDVDASLIREFPVGGTIQTIIGDGSLSNPVAGVAGTATGLNAFGSGVLWDSFVMNPTNGDTYVKYAYSHVFRLNRATNLMENVAGGGATDYFSALSENILGNQVRFAGSYATNPVGFDTNTNQLLVWRHTWGGVYHESSFFKLLDTDDSFRVYNLAGVQGVDPDTGVSQTTFCASGTASDSCKLPYTHYKLTRMSFDTAGNRWIIIARQSNKVYSFVKGGTVTVLATLPYIIHNYVYKKEAGQDIVYYCATNGNLYRYNMTTPGNTQLPVAVPNFYCDGNSMVYSPERNTLIFNFRQNGLYGVAEYAL